MEDSSFLYTYCEHSSSLIFLDVVYAKRDNYFLELNNSQAGWNQETNKNSLTLEKMVFEHLITQRGAGQMLCFTVYLSGYSKDSGEPGLDTAGQVHSYGTGLRASQKTPWNLEPGLVEPTVRAVGRWTAALLGHLWGRGWWPWGAGMGSWAVGSVASPRAWTGMVRAGGALRTMAVTFFCEDIWEDLRNVHLQNREEQSSHPDRI